MANNNILIRSKLKKAQSLFNENKLNEAKALYEQIYNANRNNHDVALELAVINRKLKQFGETANICKNVLANAPQNALAHHIHGSALQCLGDTNGAIAEYKTAIQLNNKLIEAHYFLGNIYRELGKFDLAADSYAKAIELQPNYYEALNNYAAALIELHRPVEAREILNTAMRINPHSSQLLCNIANLCMLEGNTDEAYKFAAKAHLADPSFIDALKLLGKIHFQRSEYDKSLNYYKLTQNYSNDIETIGSIAHILERRSEFDAALDLIKPLIDAGTTNSAILLTYSALSRKYGTQRTAISCIEQKLATDSTVNMQHRVSLHSELGKQYDALKEYDKAFYHYKEANLLDRELNKQMQDYVEEKDLNNTTASEIRTWPAQYDSSFWKSLPRSGNTSDRPIFVVGMFRSGTTLAEQILSSHPEVHGAGELKDINNISFSFGNSAYHDKSPASLVNVTQQQLALAANRYLATLKEHSIEAKRVVDKMPANFAHVGLISLLFPNAHIIHMIRDPRDVCLSMYFQRFGAQMTFSTDLEELADYYLSYQHFMKYWHHVSDAKILDINYEDLTENPEANIRKMIEFCGLEWNESCLNFHENKRDVNTPSYDQVRKPMYRKSVARWKNYEQQLEPLIKRLKLC